MVKPINPNAVSEHVCECDKDSDGHPKADATVWKIRPLSAAEDAFVRQRGAEVRLATDGSQVLKTDPRTMAIYQVHFGLMGYEGFDVPFAVENEGGREHATRRLSQAVIDAIPHEIRVELGNAIHALSKLDGDDLGNSG